MQPISVIVYEPIIIKEIAAKYNLSIDGPAFRVPFYAINNNTILFNGGPDKSLIAESLVKALGGTLEFQSASKDEIEPDEPLNEPADESESEEDVKGAKTKEATHKQADQMISYFDVSITGARDGDVLVGVSKGTTKTLIKIHGDTVKPRAKDLNAIRQYPDLWKKFLNKLGGLAFFQTMSISDREKWLKKEQQTSDAYIGEESDNTWIELMQPGDGLLVSDNVEPDDLERLMEGNPDQEHGWWNQQQIIDIIPAKPGSKARRHTLFFNKGFWKIASDFKEAKSFDGIVFDIFQGQVAEGAVPTMDQKLLIVDDITAEIEQAKGSVSGRTTAGSKKVGTKWTTNKTQSIGFLIDSEQLVLNWSNLLPLIQEILKEIDTIVPKKTLELVRANFKEYTAASYKSLIQKCVRFRAKYVELMPEIDGGGSVPTQVVLLMAMAALAINPGSFVPDIQRYVTGLESLAKRTGVIICEDSSIDDPCKLQSLFSAALLAQRVRTWRPSRRVLKSWMLSALDAWTRKLKYDFRIEDGLKLKPFVISADNTPIENCSAILDEIRSFLGDIGMVRNEAAKYEEVTAYWNKSIDIQEIETMPIWHDCDQHVWTSVALLYPPQLVEEIHDESTEPASTPFLTLFSRLFKEVTGFNPRRTESLYRPLGFKDKGHNKVTRKIVWDSNEKFVLATRRAQHAFLVAKQIDKKIRPAIGNDTYTLSYELDISWLAGLVGVIDVKGSPAVIVTLNASDPLLLTAVRRPARQMKDEGISAEREEEAKEAARQLLRKGLPLNKAQSPSPFLKGAFVYLRTDADSGDYYVIKKGSVEKTWEEARQTIIQLRYHEIIEKTLENEILYIGDGIEENSWDALDDLYLDTDDETIRRVLYYISTFRSSFEMNRISRDGGAVQQAVSVKDVGAYQFLLHICALFPAALRLDNYQPSKFTSPIGPLLWKIRDWLKGKLAENVQDDNIWDEEEIYDRNERKPWEHQTSSLQEMIDNHERGIRGTYLYLSPGLGKSLIVMYFIKYLAEHKQLHPYIIYSLPSSAIESVCEEIMAFGLEINLMVPLKTKKKIAAPKGIKVSYTCEPTEGVVNMIEHDYLRRCQEDLSLVADQSLIIFDEVHKMLADTQRTSAALQISRLAKEFVVLTGTPVIDNKIYRLVPWLEQIVNFQVNERNFWAAAAIMVSRKASTGIKTEHFQIEAPFTPLEEDKYKKLVPPGLGGTAAFSRMDNIKTATDLSYQACDREMIRQVIQLLGDDRGVMVVAATSDHQEKLKDMLIIAGVKSNDIFLITGKQSIFLTDEAVAKKKVPAYKVVITVKTHSEGYTLTYLNAMVSGVYPSNQANRAQLEGRIDRLGSKHKLVTYIYVMAGILTYIYEHHNQARSLSLALQDIAKEVDAK